jgi:hypothetical protein
LIVVYSISPGLAASQHISQNYFITKQLVAVGLGLVAFALAYYLPLKTWLSGAVALLVLAGVCSIAVMLSPVDTVHNAHRWIRLGGFSFQAVEVIKLATLVWLAAFLARRWRGGRLDDFKATFQPLLILLAERFRFGCGHRGDDGHNGLRRGHTDKKNRHVRRDYHSSGCFGDWQQRLPPRAPGDVFTS